MQKKKKKRMFHTTQGYHSHLQICSTMHENLKTCIKQIVKKLALAIDPHDQSRSIDYL